MKYHLDDKVTLKSGESGTVIGRAEYLNREPCYLLRYKAADGRLTEAWWDESTICL